LIRFYRAIGYCISIVVFISVINAYCSDKPIWPVDSKPAITSSFGEYRPGHFHSGIDLKLYGRVGDPCRAIDDGWVIRVKVSPTGYGRALYLKLNDGRTAVYAHLDRFASEIEEIVKRLQHEHESFSVQEFFESDSAIHYKKGDIVAYAGRSGTRHPHVHFEVRDANEIPMNAWFEGFKVSDKTPPHPVAIAIEPLDGKSTVELDCQPRIWSHLIQRNDGIWGPRDPVGVSGCIGISVDAFDKTNSSENLLAVYKVEMYVNDVKRWETVFDEFSFSESKLIKVERNYRLLRRGKGIFHRLFHAPGNELKLCSGNGILYTGSIDDFPINVVILLIDAAGNQTRLEATLVADDDPDDNRLVTGDPMITFKGWGNPEHEKVCMEIFDNYLRFSCPPGIHSILLNGVYSIPLLTKSIGGREVTVYTPPVMLDNGLNVSVIDLEGNSIEKCDIDLHTVLHSVTSDNTTIVKSRDENIVLDIPSASLYDTMWVRIIPEESYIVPGKVESVYRIEPRDQPLKSKVSVKYKSNVKIADEPGWGIYYLDKRVGWTFLGNTFEDGYLVAPALSWEIFGLVQDQDLPYIKIKKPIVNAEVKSSVFSFLAVIDDTTSGLNAADITVTIDGEIVPAEYDPPRDRILYKPWKKIPVGSHQLVISVIDRVGNESVRKVNFRIIK